MSAEPIHLSNATPFDLIVESIEDLLVEAHNYADGHPVTTQEQADEVARIIDGLNDGAKALEAERVVQKKPLDDQIQAIQDKFNVWLAPLKNKTPGKIARAVDALKASRRDYLMKLEAEQEAARREAREEAETKAREAAEAARAAAPDDLEAREAAEAKAQAAEQAQAEARAAEKAKAHAHGGGRAQGLRTRVVAEITDLDAAVRHYWAENRPAFMDLVQRLANDDARQNRRAAEGKGVTFREERY